MDCDSLCVLKSVLPLSLDGLAFENFQAFLGYRLQLFISQGEWFPPESLTWHLKFT